MRLIFLNLFASALCISAFAESHAFEEQNQWNGFYAGFNTGWGFSKVHANTSTQFAQGGYFFTTSVPKINEVGAFRLHSIAFEEGVQIGYNWQTCNWIVGLETEFDAFLLNATKTVVVPYPCCAPSAFIMKQSVKTNWLYTLRPRLGFAFCRWMIYGTGGLSVTDIKYKEIFTDTFDDAFEYAFEKRKKVGWCLGAGIEYAFSRCITLRAEYLHTQFGKITENDNNLTTHRRATAWPTNPFFHSADLRADIVRFGINYRL